MDLRIFSMIERLYHSLENRRNKLKLSRTSSQLCTTGLSAVCKIPEHLVSLFEYLTSFIVLLNGLEFQRHSKRARNLLGVWNFFLGNTDSENLQSKPLDNYVSWPNLLIFTAFFRSCQTPSTVFSMATLNWWSPSQIIVWNYSKRHSNCETSFCSVNALFTSWVLGANQDL